MAKSIFRKAALERLSSPEQLDQLMPLLSPGGWLALVALGVLICCALAWGFLGRIPVKVYGQGILLNPRGIFNVVSHSGGAVTAVNVAVNDKVVSGQIVARVAEQQLLEKIKALKARLRDQQIDLQTTMSFGSEEMAAQKRLLAKKRHDLERANKDLQRRLRWYRQRVRNQKVLLQKGLIIRETLQDTLERIDQADQQLAANERAIRQTHIDELELENKYDQEIENREQLIHSTETELKNLQFELATTSQVRSPYNGRVLAVMVRPGGTVGVGAPLLRLQLTGRDMGNLEAVLYVNAAQGKKVRPGMAAEISPTTVKEEQYGFIRAIVTNVSGYAASSEGMYRVLQDRTLVKAMSARIVPLEITAELIPDPRTVSGYRWSSPKGPPLHILGGTLCGAGITVSEQSPISLVIPLFKKYVLGVGEEPGAEASGG